MAIMRNQRHKNDNNETQRRMRRRRGRNRRTTRSISISATAHEWTFVGNQKNNSAKQEREVDKKKARISRQNE